MKAHFTTVALAATLCSLSASAWAGDAARGLQIAKQVDKANDGFKGESSTMEMVLINAHGDTTRRKMKSIVKETSGDGDKSRIEFLWPADVKGTRMLTWSHRKGSDDQWLFLPALKRVKRITSRNKSGSFMGSEFAYEDLGSQEVEKFKHEFLSEETLNGRKVWKVVRVPVDSKSGYSKQLVWIDKGYMNAVKIEYYDRKGTLLKVAEFLDYKKFGNYWRANKIDMVNKQTRKRSTITWTDRSLGKSHDEDDFDNDELGE